MLLKDVIGFNSELFFDGAVNVKWLYDDIDRFKKAANSFIFHNDDFLKDKNQTSTLGFLKDIHDVINDDTGKMNNLIMGIASYGSGKSHFLTSIYTLFSNNNNIIKNDQVIKNIAHYDEDFAINYQKTISKPNIVIILNGMEDFDLSVEMEKQVRFILEKSKIDADIFDSKDIIYKGMKSFIDVAYGSKKFNEFLQETNERIIDTSKQFLINNLDKDIKVFNFVNKANLYVLNRDFKVIDYLNPKTILENVCNKLCGDGNPFDKVIILFDEIGRYIYWMSRYHSNNSTIQQLFEGLQSYSNKVTFISFSQKSLDSYYNDLPREKIDTITRYIDRFKSSKKYYLSNIIEMIFSKLIKIKIPDIIKNNNECIYPTLVRWIPDIETKYIWSSRDAYEHHIKKKLFIFHPLTIYSLVALSEFTQKRSAINVLFSLIHNFENTDVRNFDTIRSCDLFDTDIIEDIMGNDSFNNSALSLLQKYKTVINRAKNDIFLKAVDIKVLQAITLIRILSFNINSYKDYQILIMHISATKIENINESLARMQDNLGIIVYAEKKFSHYIDENSSSKSDLLKYLRSKKEENNDDWVNNVSFINSMVQKYGGDQLQNLACNIKSSISTREWYFTQTFVHCDSFTKYYISDGKKKILENKEIKDPRSNIYWIYFNSKAQHNFDWYINNIKQYQNELHLSSIPYYTFLIYDEDFALIEKGLDLLALENLSDSDSAKYSKFLSDVHNEISDSFVNEIISLKSSGWFIDSYNYTKYTDYKRYLNEKIENLYPDLIPIRYESMDNKTLTGVKDYLRLAMQFSTNSLDKKDITKTLTPQLKQRFEITFGKHGWNIFDEKGQMKNKFGEPLDKVMNRLNDYLNSDESEYLAKELFDYFFAPPYGINIYTFLFIIAIYFKVYDKNYLFEYNNEELLFHDWFSIVCQEKKSVIMALEDSVITINKYPESHNVIQSLINTTDFDEFLSMISKKLLCKIENIDFSKASLIKNKWQAIKDFENILDDLKKFKEKLFDSDHNLKTTDIMNNLREIAMLNNRFSEIDKALKSYFNNYQDQVDKLYRNTEMNISRKVENILTTWNTETKEEYMFEIESKLNNIELIKESLDLYSYNGLSKILKTKKLNLQEIITNFNKYNELIKSYNIVNKVARHTELLIYKKELRTLKNQVMLDELLTSSIKTELSSNIDDVINIILNKIDSDNAKVNAFIENIPNYKITDLKSLLDFREQIYEQISVIGQSNEFYTILYRVMCEVDKLNNDIGKIRFQEITIDDIKHQLNVLKSNINENLNINKFIENEEKFLVNTVLDKNKKFIDRIFDLKQNKILDRQDVINLINKIENRPPSLEKQDIIFVESIKNELISTGNELIGSQILNLFNKITDNDYKESIVEKLMNKVSSLI